MPDQGPVGFGQRQARVVKAPSPGTLTVTALHYPHLARDELAEYYLLTYVDFLTPNRLLLGHSGSDALEPLKFH